MFKGPWSDQETAEFLEHFFYSPEAFLISDVLNADPEAKEVTAQVKADSKWLVSPYQRGPESRHPRHVSGPDMVMLTAALGSLHAYFFHSCKWKDGWVGFGSRMEEVEFHNLARIDLPLSLHSKELRGRRGARRTLIEFEFKFTQ